MKNLDFKIANASISVSENNNFPLLVVDTHIHCLVIAGFKTKGYRFRENSTVVIIVPQGMTSKKYNKWIASEFLPVLPSSSYYYVIDARKFKAIDNFGKKLQKSETNGHN